MTVVLVLIVLAGLWVLILVGPKMRHHPDVHSDVERQERTLRALGHAAGWKDK